MDAQSDLIRVELALALPDRQSIKEMMVKRGTTVMEAFEASGMKEEFLATHPQPLEFGIFSEPCDGSRVLVEDDRIEVYRPLVFDPKDRRRMMAAKSQNQAKRGKGGKN